jgi:hypothetical protein
VRKMLTLGGALAVLAAATAAPAGATNECRGLNPCVPVAGPWVVVPVGRGVPRPEVQYQLTCPRGFVIAGVDAELSVRAIDVSFFGSSGSPVSPGITTSRSVVFVASYVGGGAQPQTFRPHAGCVPASGGGQRTPTGVAAVFPPGRPTIRRVQTQRVTSTAQIVVACRSDERLVGWYAARGFFTPTPPTAALISSLSVTLRVRGDRVFASARAGRGPGVVQVSAVCGGGR